MREYDEIFDWYVGERSPTIGLPEVHQLVLKLPKSSRVLDLGCGTGIPITEFLLGEGFEVYGVDSSSRMISEFQLKFPSAHAAHERIEDSSLFNTVFDAVVSWGVLFHLKPSIQKLVIRKVANALRTGGKFLFTSGEASGRRSGEMNGIAFEYFSLGCEEYREVLGENGLVLIHQHYDPAENFVYLAEKRS